MFIDIEEEPSICIEKEKYSLYIRTSHCDEIPTHRKIGIAHHLGQEKHSFPHIDFKFHTEEIGKFRIRIDFENNDEYIIGILAFIYKMKKIMENLEQYHKDIANEMLVLDLVLPLKKHEKLLNEKIFAGIKKYSVEFENRLKPKILDNIKNNNMLLIFLGTQNIEKIIKSGNEENIH